MPKSLTRVIPNQAPTLLNAEKANELIDCVNGLMSSRGSGGIKVQPEGNGRLVISIDSDSGGGASGVDGGGVNTIRLQYVRDDNTVGEATFLIQ